MRRDATDVAIPRVFLEVGFELLKVRLGDVTVLQEGK